MAPLAFTTPFTGSTLRAQSTRSYNTPRCEMGDSVAPKISLKNTGFDGTSRVDIEWVVVPPNVAEAISVEADTALAVSLRSKTNTPTTLPAPKECPPGVSPADFYFPPESRSSAPVITLAYNESISVNYEKIDPSVAGVSAGSQDSIAFWKKPAYKYAAPEGTSEVPQQEAISTAKFEKYFPSKVRNFAPMINIKAPKGDWDISAYLEVGSEFVSLSPDLAREVSVSGGMDAPAVAGAATVEKYYGDRMHMAPDLSIQYKYKMVEMTMIQVPEPVAEAEAILESARAA